VVSFDVRAADPDQARQRAFAVLDAVRTLTLSTNLGDVKTLVSHPASTSHGRLTEEQRQAAGIGQGLIRMSVGLENVGDLKADLARALDTPGK
jgi:O-succinylhomoserine sulfhydrylase